MFARVDFRRGPDFLSRRQMLERVGNTPKVIPDQFCFFGFLDYNEPPAAKNSAKPKYKQTDYNGRENREPFPRQRGN
jgi:hypothetical protein